MQAAEASQFDEAIGNCTDGAVATGWLSDLRQTDASSMTVRYSGFATLPSLIWLTNEEGTVIAMTAVAVMNPVTNPVSLSWSTAAYLPQDQPLDVQAHSCPPAGNFSAPVRAWRGVYEDELAICCAELDATDADVASYRPTLTLEWNSQRYRVRATSKAPRLNYVRGSSGMVLRVDAGSATGTYDVRAKFPPMTTEVLACALLNDENINPICRNESMVRPIERNIVHPHSCDD